MVNTIIKIHDKFSIEMKVSLNAKKKLKKSDLQINTWIFVPNSLDINRLTYLSRDFYRDVSSNLRLITPTYLLREIASGKETPFVQLEENFQSRAIDPTRTNTFNYSYHIKMFMSILKSAMRDEMNHIIRNRKTDDFNYLLNEYFKNADIIKHRYRDLKQVINVPSFTEELLQYYNFGDQFIGNIIEQHCFKILRVLKETEDNKEIRDRIIQEIEEEVNYKKKNKELLLTKDLNNKKNNRLVIYRRGTLKKIMESALYLDIKSKRDGVIVEQVYYSIAAGLSMIFATIIAFSFQQKYGNFTMPFFVALVISYMLKDRIKELTRYYFAHKVVKRHFDFKKELNIHGENIGWSKEAFDFIQEAKVPTEITNFRNRTPLAELDNKIFTEKVILYRKVIRLFRPKIDKFKSYNFKGVNDIIRINLSSIINKMDDPRVPLYILERQENKEATLLKIKGEKIYNFHFIIHFKYEEDVFYKKFRVTMNREGIKEIIIL